MLLRALQRFVRFAPGPVRLAWAAVPRRLRDAAQPFIHPIAAGPRGGSLLLEVPEDGPLRGFAVVAESDTLRKHAPLAGDLRDAGYGVLDLGGRDIVEVAKKEHVLDAVYIGDPACADRAAIARRLGWRSFGALDAIRQGNGSATGTKARVIELVKGAFPTVSVVVVTHSNAALCRACLAALNRNTPWPRLEVVVVDNGSADATRPMLQALAQQDDRIRLILNGENHGFSTAANQGIRASSGEFVVLLNDDAAVGPGWLSRLVARFESNERFGLVCPVTNETNNLARVPVSYTTFAEMESFAERRAVDYWGAWRETEMISLFCALTRRSILDDVDLLDERFAVGMFEDDDLSHSLRKRGFDLGIALDSFVHHVGQASFSRLGDTEYLALWEANRRRFEEKWGVRWHPPRRELV
jgi:GT2 family glycosyltransferase